MIFDLLRGAALCRAASYRFWKETGRIKRQRLLWALRGQAAPLLRQTRLWRSDRAIQHGDTTVLLHSLAVAYFSLKLAEGLGLSCDRESLVRGALLHDYFLYDWHEKDPSHRLHGFRHAAVALKNAQKDLELTGKERDIIAHHMFPLNLAPPRCREALLVCLVDKGCGVYETFGRNTYPALRRLLRELAGRELAPARGLTNGEKCAIIL